MVQIGDNGQEELVRAVLLWTGSGSSVYPSRNDDVIRGKYPPDIAEAILIKVKYFEAEFYSSNAQHFAQDLPSMGRQAIVDFKKKHPEVDQRIAEAFAWCYTYDFK